MDRGKFECENAAVSHPADFKPSPWRDNQLPRSMKPKQKARDALISAEIRSPAGWLTGENRRVSILSARDTTRTKKAPLPGGGAGVNSSCL